MRDLFVTALLASTSPIMIAQAADQPPRYYVETYAFCQDVENLSPDSAHNDFYPISSVIASSAVKADLKITQVEAPKHGSIRVIDSYFGQYTFIPDKDYLGKDRVIYEIEQQGKHYKVTINFWIVPVIQDSPLESGEVLRPQCEYQDFGK